MYVRTYVCIHAYIPIDRDRDRDRDRHRERERARSPLSSLGSRSGKLDDLQNDPELQPIFEEMAGALGTQHSRKSACKSGVVHIYPKTLLKISRPPKTWI